MIVEADKKGSQVNDESVTTLEQYTCVNKSATQLSDWDQEEDQKTVKNGQQKSQASGGDIGIRDYEKELADHLYRSQGLTQEQINNYSYTEH